MGWSLCVGCCELVAVSVGYFLLGVVGRGSFAVSCAHCRLLWVGRCGLVTVGWLQVFMEAAGTREQQAGTH